jgi:DNA-binding NarL/FixJ family response regulator
MKIIKILIVDNRNIVRAGIIAMLTSRKKDYEFSFKEVENIDDGLDIVQSTDFDIAIINFCHPKLNGEELITLFLNAKPELKILVLRNRYDYICQEILQKAGAKGFLLKNIDVDELFNAIGTLMDGGYYYCSEITDSNKKLPMNDIDRRLDFRHSLLNLLSKRELEVLKYIVEEYTNEQIGEKLFISKRTVDTHRQNLLHKLGVKNTAGLVKYALELKLIE